MASFDPLTDFIQLPTDGDGKMSAYVALGNGLYIPGTVLTTPDGDYVDGGNALPIEGGIGLEVAESVTDAAPDTVLLGPVDISKYRHVTVQSTGDFDWGYSFEVSVDGTNWFSVPQEDSETGLSRGEWFGVGILSAPLPGKHFRVSTSGGGTGTHVLTAVFKRSAQTGQSVFAQLFDGDGSPITRHTLSDGYGGGFGEPYVFNVGSFPSVYNGATWDRLRGTADSGVRVEMGRSDLVVTGSGADTADVVIASTDVSHYREATVLLEAGAGADGNVIFEQSVDGSNWQTVDLNQMGGTQVLFDGHAPIFDGDDTVWVIPLRARYLRARLDMAVSGTVDATAHFYRSATPRSTSAVEIVGQSGYVNVVGASTGPDDGWTPFTPLETFNMPLVYNGADWDLARSANAADGTPGAGVPAAGLMGWNGADWKRLRVTTGTPELWTRDHWLDAAAWDLTSDAFDASSVGILTLGANMLYNGTTWDRMRGDITNGLDVDVTRVSGTVTVGDGGSTLSVDDGGGSLTVDGTFWQATQPVSGPLTDAQLRASAVPVSGTFWQATQPVSVAAVVHVDDNSSTLSVDDGGGSLTVDGTFWQATQPVSGTFFQATQPVSIAAAVPVTDNSGSLTVDDGGGSLTVDGSVTVSGSITADTELTTADLDSGAGTDTRAVVGLVIAKSGGAANISNSDPLPISDAGGSLTVDGTVAATQSGTWNVGTLTTITNVVHVDDNSGSLSIDDGGGSITIDGTVAVSALSGSVDTELTTADLDTGAGTDTRAVVGLALAASGGALLVGSANPIPISDNSGSLTVDNAGTFAVQATLSAETTKVIGTVNQGTSPWVVSGAVTNTVLSVVGGGTEAAAQRVTLASDSTGVLTVKQATGTNLHTVLDSGTLSTITNVVHVDDNAGTLSVDDGAGSLTVDNPILSIVGGGTEAAAMRVTIASDSTGVLSVDDNGGNLSIDDGGNSITVDQATGTNLHVVLDSGTLTTLSTLTSITNVVHVDDNSGTLSVDDGAGTLTVDAPVGTPLFARLSDGSAALIGQKAMSLSLPVVLASDQTSIPVAATLAAETTKVIGTVNQGTSPWVVGGNVADAATDSGNPLKVGGVFNAATGHAGTLTAGQRADLQLNAKGALLTALQTQSGTAYPSSSGSNDGLVGDVTFPAASYLIGFNGSSWDRLRSDTTNGLDVDVTRVSGTVTVGQATGTNLHTVLDSGTLSTITNVVHIDDNSGLISVDDGGGTLTVDDGGTSLTVDSPGLPTALGQALMAASMPVVFASNQSAIPITGAIAAAEYNATAPTYTDGDTTVLQSSVEGRLLVELPTLDFSSGDSYAAVHDPRVRAVLAEIALTLQQILDVQRQNAPNS